MPLSGALYDDAPPPQKPPKQPKSRVVEGEAERSHSVGRFAYQCARQSILINRVSNNPVARFIRYDEQLAVGTETDLGIVSPRAAIQQAKGPGKGVSSP